MANYLGEATMQNLTMEVLITILVTLQIRENFLCNLVMMLSVLQNVP
jgi:hypothetical protein